MGCECNKSSLEQDKNNELNQTDEKNQSQKIQINLLKDNEELNSNIEPIFKKDKDEVLSQINIHLNINQNENENENEEKKLKNIQYSSQDNSINQMKNNSLSQENSLIKKEKDNKNPINFNLKVIELINNIRSDPVSFAEIIEESKKNIRIERVIVKDKITGDEIEKEKIIYKKKVKVALSKGEIAFTEASNYLKTLNPIPPLEYNENIVLKLPETESQMKDSSYLKLQAEEVKRRFNVDCYFKDLIKDPFVSTLLMVVDDNGKNGGKKRKAILNPEYKYIGVDSKFFGKTFIAYFSFSKNK
jgi:hypothetical protein